MAALSPFCRPGTMPSAVLGTMVLQALIAGAEELFLRSCPRSWRPWRCRPG